MVALVISAIRRIGVERLRCSACPCRSEDYLTKVGALEAWIFERQHIIVNRTKSAVWPVLHAVVKGVNDVLLKTGAARVGSDNRFPLLWRELLIGESKDIHLDTSRNERDLGLLYSGIPGVVCSAIASQTVSTEASGMP